LSWTKIKYLIFVLLLFPLLSIAQKAEKQDPSYHSPRKASIYSAVLPGLGQAYNKKYWKIPIVYAGVGSFGYLAWQNQSAFSEYKNAYILLDNNQPNNYPNFNKQALINLMDEYRKQRDLCILGVVAFYAIQIVDANVDANLFDFDISDDLTLRLVPTVKPGMQSPAPVTGITCTLKF
jgi:hypothetical protein